MWRGHGGRERDERTVEEVERRPSKRFVQNSEKFIEDTV